MYIFECEILSLLYIYILVINISNCNKWMFWVKNIELLLDREVLNFFKLIMMKYMNDFLMF